MTVNRYLRMIAGFFVVLSVVLSQVHSVYWLFFRRRGGGGPGARREDRRRGGRRLHADEFRDQQ